MLVYLDRGELADAVTFVLCPKGKYRVPSRRNLRSRHGLSSCSVRWHAVELWTIPAEVLWAAEDIGLIPWVPLTDFADPPETVIRRCREAIEQDAPAAEKANLLVVTHVLTSLRYNDPGLLTLLGGKQAMLESPLIQELVAEEAEKLAAVKAEELAAERTRRNFLTFLETRFGAVPHELAQEIESVVDDERLTDLVRNAASCPDLAAFRRAMPHR